MNSNHGSERPLILALRYRSGPHDPLTNGTVAPSASPTPQSQEGGLPERGCDDAAAWLEWAALNG